MNRIYGYIVWFYQNAPAPVKRYRWKKYRWKFKKPIWLTDNCLSDRLFFPWSDCNTFSLIPWRLRFFLMVGGCKEWMEEKNRLWMVVIGCQRLWKLGNSWKDVKDGPSPTCFGFEPSFCFEINLILLPFYTYNKSSSNTHRVSLHRDLPACRRSLLNVF